MTLADLLDRLHRLRTWVAAAFDDPEFTDPEATEALTFTPILYEPPIGDEDTVEMYNVKPLWWPCPYCHQRVYECDFDEHLETCRLSMWNRRGLSK